MLGKKLLILANSHRDGGRCIAGKDIKTKEWIRPIRNEEEHGLENYKFLKYKTLEIWDIILSEHSPSKTQPENHIIFKVDWERKEKEEKDNIEEFLDEPCNLWLYDSHRDNKNNRVLSKLIENKSIEIKQSLYLIKVNNLTCVYNYRTEKWRAQFTYNKVEYDLSITDEKYTDKCLIKMQEYEKKQKENGLIISKLSSDLGISQDHHYVVAKNHNSFTMTSKNDSYLTVSLANKPEDDDYNDEHWRDYCYKLVAAIL